MIVFQSSHIIACILPVLRSRIAEGGDCGSPLPLSYCSREAIAPEPLRPVKALPFTLGHKSKKAFAKIREIRVKAPRLSTFALKTALSALRLLLFKNPQTCARLRKAVPSCASISPREGGGSASPTKVLTCPDPSRFVQARRALFQKKKIVYFLASVVSNRLHFLLANGLFIGSTIPLYVYRHLYCTCHAL
jgi:hypothetical protein